MKAPYDLVLIAGPDIPMKQLEPAYAQSGMEYIILGNGNDPVTEEDFTKLDGRIGRRTRIDIFAHGNAQQGNHFILLEKETSVTADILTRIGKATRPKDPADKDDLHHFLQVHLWSCYGGAASKDSDVLPDPAVLITHASPAHISYLSMNEQGIISGISRHKSGISPFLDFAHAITTSPETATLTTHYDCDMIDYTARCSDIPLTHELPRDLTDRLLHNYLQTLHPLRGINGYDALTDALDALPAFEAAALQKYQEDASVIRQNLRNPDYLKRLLATSTPMKSLLLFAARHADIPIVTLALADPRIDKNTIDENGHTALHWTVKNNREDMLTLIIETSGTNGNAKDNDGNTALHLAAKTPNRAHLITHFDFYAHEDATNNNGQTPLHLAASAGLPANITALLDLRITPPITADRDGATPLHYAARDAGPESVAAFLSHKHRDVTARDHHQRTPLHYSAENKNAATLAALLADPKTDPNAQDDAKTTPLHITARCGNKEHTEALLASPRLNPNLRDRADNTALHDAISFDNEPAALAIIADPRVDPDIQCTHNGYTALHYAVENQSLTIIAALLKRGARTNLKDTDGRTALDLARSLLSPSVKDLPLRPDEIIASAIIAELIPLPSFASRLPAPQLADERPRQLPKRRIAAKPIPLPPLSPGDSGSFTERLDRAIARQSLTVR